MRELTHVGTAAPGWSSRVQTRTGLFLRCAKRTEVFHLPLLPPRCARIFDESAYARFLNQKHLVSSRDAYAAFRREQ
jgi:uncharacterized C2H2 Zn-finger protein